MRNRRRSRLSRFALASFFLGLGSLALASPVRAQVVVFQPGFHQALHVSVSTSTRTTYRTKIPIGRGGARMRISFKAGDGSMTLHSATVAMAGSGGKLASAPVAITFNGSPGFTSNARERVTSDPIAFPVSFGNELYVSFDVDGAMAASNINAFPDSYAWAGGSVTAQNPPAGTPFMRAAAVDTIDVEGPSGIAMVALGDSITEGYVSGNVGNYLSRNDDYRNSWPAIAQGLLGVPVVNAAVSGQGVFEATARLQTEVFTMQGLTDCLVLIGTNDLGGSTPDQIDAGLSALFDELRPVCRIWVGTLLPKEQTCCIDLATMIARRIAVNDWIRHQAKVNGIIDFETALAQTGDVNHFAAGLGEDGIHPSIAGQRIMGEEAARVLSPLIASSGAPGPRIEAIRPTSGASSGGTAVAISGVNFMPGSTLTIGGVPAIHVEVAGSTNLTATTGPRDPGPADIVLTNPDGRSATLALGFTYVASADPGPATTSGGCSGPGAHPSLLLLVPVLAIIGSRRSMMRRVVRRGR
jgi:lysophospholipase L1-like esterase